MHRILLTALYLLISIPASPTGQSETPPPPTSLNPVVSIEGGTQDARQTVFDLPPTTTQPVREPIALTPAERELVDWVTGRFALVDLHLPEVDVTFHDDSSACEFHDGIYYGDDAHHRVLVCIPDRGTFASDLERQRTLTHEFAHVWEQANLDDIDRESLLSVVDAQDWYASESAWGERGAERFAETIVWGLYDQLRRPTLIDAPCAELHADFHAITGFTSPSPVAAGC